jgi:NAD-dependent deacetylase
MALVKLSASLEEATALIQNAKFAVALTGAGSSTPSGIPDFRSHGSGLWTRYSPHEVASLTAFRRHPERFYKWLRPLVSHILSTEPNPAHIALAQLEKSKFLKTTITQNIDGLHQRAGSENVLEVHGNLKTLTCIGCYKKVEANDYMELYINEEKIPHCPHCGNYLKPDIVLFEEQLPSKTWLKARQTSEACDLMIVAGTSLVVSPVAQLPDRAKNNGAHIIIVNKSSTYMDPQADIVIHADVAEVFPKITAKVLNE